MRVLPQRTYEWQSFRESIVRTMRLFILISVSFLLLSGSGSVVFADTAAFRSTQYPLPRFVSLRADEVYVRTGPGHKYPVQWVLKKQGLPVEIILEFDNWRKIKLHDGVTGWVHQSLLSGRRTAFVISGENAPLYKKKSKHSGVVASIEPMVLAQIKECESSWCYAEIASFKGWIQKSVLWGVYEDEKFD